MTGPNPPNTAENGNPPAGPDPNELPDKPPDLDKLDVFEEDPSEYEDLNEFVKAEWAETKTGRQRVKDIISRASSPLSVAKVAELAEVSKPTARNKLKDLVEEGVVLAEDTENGCIYRRDPDWYRIKRIRELSQTNRAHLEEILRQLETEVDYYKETYEEDTPEDLILSDGTLSEETWEDISQWRTAIVDIGYLRTALQYCRLKKYEDYIPDSDKNKNLNAA